MSDWTIPSGKNKGMPITEAPEEDLIYWAERIGKELDEGTIDPKFRDRNMKQHQAFVDELAQRGHAQMEIPQTSAKPTGQADKVEQQFTPNEKAAMVVSSPSDITGSFRDMKDITDRFQKAAQNFHFVSPATSCPKLPEGCSVALSAITIDKDNDTYKTGDKLALGKSTLQKISLAAGIAWDPRQSGRTDNGSDPHYCSWRMVGEMRLFDGTTIPLIGSKEMDLRDGSAQVQALWERYEAAKRYKAKNSNAKEPKEPTAQIREMRLHIAAHAETKAQLRAIRSIGIRTSYKPAELDKPFVVARLMWTGETDNSALRDKFAMMQAEAMLGANRSLYGEAPQTTPQLPRHAPPQIGATSVDNDDFPDEGDY
jgi:hypothetical protein